MMKRFASSGPAAAARDSFSISKGHDVDDDDDDDDGAAAAADDRRDEETGGKGGGGSGILRG